MNLCLIANPNLSLTKRWVDFFLNKDYKICLIGEHPSSHTYSPDVIYYDLPSFMNVRKFRYLVWPFIIRSVVKVNQPDILHALSITSAGWLGQASNFHPFLVTTIGSDLLLLHQQTLLHRQLSIMALRKADIVLCVSHQLAQVAIKDYGLLAGKVAVIPWGVNTEIFFPTNKKQKIRYKLNLGNNPIVLSIRAMNYLYNPLDIADAIPMIQREVPNVRFLIFTYNQDEELLIKFKRKIKKYNVDQAVEFIKPLIDDNMIADYYRAVDVSVSVPSSDGNPASVLESMACGTPVVISDLPSLHEWVDHEVEGIFVPLGDINAISSAIIRLLKDSNLHYMISQNAACKIKKMGDRKIFMEQVDNIYNKLRRA